MSVVITGGTEGVDYTISTIGNIETIRFLTASRTYTVQFPKTSTVEYTVVAAGGGGGCGGGDDNPPTKNQGGGGGGGGQVLNGVLPVLSQQVYLLEVGPGGDGARGDGISPDAPGNPGNFSFFDGIVATGGEGGLNRTIDVLQESVGGVGGAGGGPEGGAGGAGAKQDGLPISGQVGSSPGGGGGGGANSRGGAGAVGSLVNGIYYGGGGGGGGTKNGGGGSGGSGGGGSGGTLSSATNGFANTGGGGGGSTNRLLSGTGGSGIIILAYTIPEPFPCFKQDSKILTDSGYKMVQHLRKGDMVKTKNHGFVPIFAIGKRDIYHPACSERVSYQLYKCAANEYPEVFEDLVITGCHSILVDNFKEGEKDKTVELLKDIFVTDNKYRLPACIDERTSVYEVPGDYTIYHFALENDNYYMNYGVYANGLLVETCSKRYLTELSNMVMIE